MTGRQTPPSRRSRPPASLLPHSSVLSQGSAATRSKYGNKKTAVGDITFASKKEARRYAELRLLQTGKVISRLYCQPVYPLIVNDVLIGKYVGDFFYIENGRHVVEDVKGMRTPVFNLKWRMVKALYPSADWRIV